MYAKYFFSFFLIINWLAVHSQVKNPTILSLEGYGGTGFDIVSSDVTRTSDGLIVMIESSSDPGSGTIGKICSHSGYKTVFLKFNPEGSVLSSKCFEANGDSAYYYMIPQANGGYVLAGSFKATVNRGFIISGFDPSGSMVFSKTFSKGYGSIIRDFIQTSDGGYLMLAEAFNADTNVVIHHGTPVDADIWLLKLNAIGDKVWSKVIGGTKHENASKIIESPISGYYVIGNTSSIDHDALGNHGLSDGLVSRIATDGSVIWHRIIGGSNADGFSSATTNGTEGLLIAGTTFSDDGDVKHHINPGKANFWALEIDSAGNIIWENCYGGYGNEYGRTITQAVDGSIYIGGYSLRAGGQVDTAYSTGGINDGWIVKANNFGQFESGIVLGSSGEDQVRFVYSLSNNLVMMGGYYGGKTGSFSGLTFHDSSPLSSDTFIGTLAPWSTSIIDKIPKQSIIVYPNPSDDYFWIELGNSANPIRRQLSIFDQVGRRVYRSTVMSKEKISTQTWTSGLYQLILTDEMGESITASFSVN